MTVEQVVPCSKRVFYHGGHRCYDNQWRVYPVVLLILRLQCFESPPETVVRMAI